MKLANIKLNLTIYDLFKICYHIHSLHAITMWTELIVHTFSSFIGEVWLLTSNLKVDVYLHASQMEN